MKRDNKGCGKDYAFPNDAAKEQPATKGLVIKKVAKPSSESSF